MQIEAIPIPDTKFRYRCDFTQSIEYVLQRKATEYKKAGKIDLAIACLRKSNQIMPFIPMSYTDKDYPRLEEYLEIDRKFDEADLEKSNRSNIINKQNANM